MISVPSLRVIFVGLCWLILLITPNQAFLTCGNRSPLVVGGWKTNSNHHQKAKSTLSPFVGKQRQEVSLWSSTSEEMDWLKVIGKSTHIVVSGIFFATFAIQRNAFIISFWIGSIMNAILSKVLKEILNVERPTEHLNNADIKVKPSDKGMPSNHAMSLGFIGTFTILFTQSPISICLILPYTFVSLWYRIRAGLHTTNQIVVGWILGTIHATLWYHFLHPHLMEYLSLNILPPDGILPIPYLLVPLLVGTFIIGSFERRIAQFVKSKK